MTDTAPSASERQTISFAELQRLQGKLTGISDWITIDQMMLDGFADVTGDDAFIHTDPERAAQTRFGGTIAHGLLVLSLLPSMMRAALPAIEEKKMGVNYGYDRIRFTGTVPVDSRVRGHFTFVEVTERLPGFHVLRYHATVEVEGQNTPALVATWLLGLWVTHGAEKQTGA
ncbi:MaoC family dehydratase [Pseudomonas sp. PDM09]|uniref:MaoC family dehydratase n=1 Tax=Pseudomonas sp. PDM09 TaxID=2769270 RepID=UPI001781A9C6|nr:MaoC family dehydratase [Pseudomonas sp. PDM09]MBD9562280.1 MaoC family dehydratase [Pseudomonas sp. PDM09]